MSLSHKSGMFLGNVNLTTLTPKCTFLEAYIPVCSIVTDAFDGHNSIDRNMIEQESIHITNRST